MKIEHVDYRAWPEAYRCTVGPVELVVVTAIGPRILSLRVAGGANILFQDTGDFKKDVWNSYGGHRFWVGPETPHTYHADNHPCAAQVAAGLLRVTSPLDARGLEKILEISADKETGGFIVNHRLRNTTTMLAQGNIWALTCVVPHPIVVPWAAGNAAWNTPMVKFWRRWCDTATTNIESPQWKLRNDYFAIEPTGEIGKVGFYAERGFVACLRPDATFIKAYPVLPGMPYPDGGCNLELYTCDKLIEMETLSPFYTLCPGQEASHAERWIVSARTFQPEQWAKMQTLLPKGTGCFE